jgi:ABC-2 type transport system ATP-binding protein
MAAAILRTQGLVKRFGSMTAVDGLSLDVHEGEILGFLGPNGAGKTTAITMMCGLMRPDAGTVEVEGKPLFEGNEHLRNLIGMCPQRVVVWERLTCMEQLAFVGEIHGVTRRLAARRAEELLAALGLTEKAHRQARTLSGGMQRRLNLALALVHDPPIVILDEPEAGLDPQSRVLVRDFIRALGRRKTVILTTHNMDEAERLADRVAIVDRGKLLVLDTPEGVKRAASQGDVLEVKVVAGAREKLAASMERLREVAPGAVEKDGVLTVVDQAVLSRVPALLSVLTGLGMDVEDLRIRRKTLEDVFIALTGRGLRE